MTYGAAHSLDTFHGLANIANKYKISMKEVEVTILRVALRKMGAAPKCEHLPEDVIVRRDDSRIHCKRCWSWMDMLSRPNRGYGGYRGTFKPIPSELEQYLEKSLEISVGEDLK